MLDRRGKEDGVRSVYNAGRRRSRRVASAAAGLLALLVSSALPATAAAKPTGEFAVFGNCPLTVVGVNECVYGQASGGELVLGRLDVPIKNAITYQGGLEVGEKEETFVNASEGATLSKTIEEVPGGLDSLPLTLTLELVGTVAMSKKNLAEAKGVALALPVRAHLKNSYVGETCFIGSSAKPITLDLTTGATSPPAPNKAAKGSPGTLETKEAGTLEIFKSDVLLENAFSAPEASGCGSIVTPIINGKYALPSAAGHNTAIFDGTTRFATAEAVRKSE
jgi:hypothetical protein